MNKTGFVYQPFTVAPTSSRWKLFCCTLLASLFNHQLVDLFQNSSGCFFTYMQRACQTWRVANSRRMVLYQSLYILVCPRHSWCDFMFTAPLMDSEAQMGNYGNTEWISLQRPHHLNGSDASQKDTANINSRWRNEVFSPSKNDRLNIIAIFDKNTCLSMFSRCHLNPLSVRTSPWPLEVFFTYYPGEDKTPWESWQNDFLLTGGNMPPVNL